MIALGLPSDVRKISMMPKILPIGRENPLPAPTKTVVSAGAKLSYATKSCWAINTRPKDQAIAAESSDVGSIVCPNRSAG
jgi:hypothetical protein